MPAPASPALQIAAAPAAGRGGSRPGPAGLHPARRGQAGRFATAHLDLRVSDAERAEVADELSRHYGEGRLDQGEFSARLDRVMSATTYRDLAGVLQDLPSEVAAPPPVPAARSRLQRRRRHHGDGRGLLRVALLVLLVIFAVAAVHAVAWVLAPVLWIGALCAIALLAARARTRR